VEPTTGYARLGDQRIAYQVIGDGPIDILFTAGFFGSFDVEWEEPAHRLFYQHSREQRQAHPLRHAWDRSVRSDPARRASAMGVVRG
jgi:hypothetical protein